MEAPGDRTLHGQRELVARDRRPGFGLRLRQRSRGSSRSRRPAALVGRVPLELGGDQLLACGADGGEGVDHAPADGKVHVQAVELGVSIQQALHPCHVIGLSRGPDESGRPQQLQVTGGREPRKPLLRSLCHLVAQRRPFSGIAISLDGAGHPAYERSSDGRVGFDVDVGERDFDIVRHPQLRIADHVPEGFPEKGARERVVEAAQMGFEGRERPLIQRDLRVGEIVVVHEQ